MESWEYGNVKREVCMGEYGGRVNMKVVGLLGERGERGWDLGV